MKRFLLLVAALSMTACSSFKLGGMAYCPYGQVCEFKSAPAAN